eukprot:NODE_13_length_42895_cov_0.518413.p22 type:complete len:141 gc:universal NODE_13_length_42895_cov_0.518413:1340-1762(+)
MEISIMVANIIAQQTYYVPTMKSTGLNVMQLVSQYCYLDPSLMHTVLTYCPTEVILLGLYYMHYTLSSSNHFLVCLILATKFLDDYAMSLKSWSELTQIPLNILRQFELTVLQDLSYCLHVTNDFDYFCQSISAFYTYSQ